jgi:protoheme IX farnesyltransferase
MVVAQHGMPPLWLVFTTVAGGTLAAGGANAINMVVDRDIDTVMHRTRNRPLVTGLLAPTEALVFALALEVAAFALLCAKVNLL